MDIDITTGDGLLAFVGMIVSAVFLYFPKLNAEFAKLEPDYQRLIMIGIMLVVALGTFGLSCGNVIDVVTCDQGGALVLVRAFVFALIGNQSIYPILPKPGVVKMAREARAIGLG